MQYIQHEISGLGFILPSLKTCSHNVTCPLETVEVTASASSSTPVTGLSEIAWNGTYRIVTPDDNSVHKIYEFYIKTIHKGGAVNYKGPFKLEVGCTNSM